MQIELCDQRGASLSRCPSRCAVEEVGLRVQATSGAALLAWDQSNRHFGQHPIAVLAPLALFYPD